MGQGVRTLVDQEVAQTEEVASVPGLRQTTVWRRWLQVVRENAKVTVVSLLLLSGSPAAVDFDTQIVPVLTRSGCNAGACHGSAAGRGGFKLSLYGSNPESDYVAITKQWRGRRVNLVHPRRSLFFRKPTGEMDHGGDQVFEEDATAAQLILQWIQSGARRIQRRQLAGFEVSPDLRIASVNQDVPLRAAAVFSSKARRIEEDVTPWTVFKPDDPTAVTIEESTGLARANRRGRHVIVARYLDRVAALQILVPLTDGPVDLSMLPRRNFVDELVLQKLEALRIPVSAKADDAMFLRRAYLDLTGTLPPPSRIKEFLRDRRPNKRARLIDRLMQSDLFVDLWTYRLATLLRVRPQAKDRSGARTYHRWIRDQVAEGAPLDRLARQLLTATGDSHEVGPANFFRTASDARSQAELFSEVLMGVRLRCANCHDHPLDRWTQDDYHGLAAVFANVQRGRVITLRDGGEVSHPRTGEAAIPRLPGERFLTNGGDHRVSLAQWLTQKDNGYFAKAMVNRIWKWHMGRALVEPADDLRATNPATHPRLLGALAQEFVESGYDFRRIVRLICTSYVYELSSKSLPGNADDAVFYSHRLTTPLEPEVLFDALANVTGVSESFPGFGDEARAVTLFDPTVSSRSLDVLGRCDRTNGCETSAQVAGLSQKLHFLNGKLINEKVSSPSGRLHQMINTGADDASFVEEFYLRVLSRKPDGREAVFWKEQFSNATGSDRIRLAEDFLWSLLSCHEFATNH